MPPARLNEAVCVSFEMKDGSIKQYVINRPVLVAINTLTKLQDGGIFSVLNADGMLEMFRAEDVKEVEFS